VWQATPASFEGRFYSFRDVYLEPKPYRPQGPRLWFGGMSVGPWIVRRLVAYGHGFHPFGQPTPAEMRPLVEAMREAGRDPSELEIVGGIRGELPPGEGVADLDRAAEAIPGQVEAGYTTICFKPSQFTDDPAQIGALCRRLAALSSR
jgi:alkanesulfonate monooxygenase SsuD/methylene tetrahydromethanopterin reductase-like flavin-dependent oxidoreductase (luciferase family)